MTVSAARDRLRRLAAAAGWITLLVPLATVLLSVALSPAGNWTVRAALAGFCILAIVQPGAALLVTTALVGFGIILSHLAGVPPLRVTEVLVVASLAGCCVRALPHGTSFRRALTGWISAPVVLLAIAAVASAGVWLRVQQVETGYTSAFVQSLLHFVSRDYFLQTGEFSLLVSTAAILEGLALYIVVAAICCVDRTFFERALRMLTVGGAGLAVMSLVRLGQILLRNPHVLEQLRATPNGVRISPQIPDYIAAGSYFALCWLISLGFAISSPRHRLVWLAAGVPLIAGLYLTGSRSVIAAALAGLVVLVLIIVRQRAAAVGKIFAFAVVAVAVMVVGYPWSTGRDLAGETARQSLRVRVELARAGFRVIETRPLFGVGIDRFHLVAGSFASAELNALFPGRKNPHNDFLRVGAELGLVGLGLLLWIFADAGRRIWRAITTTRDARVAGLAAGLVAFLTTSLVSNPLMLREVSYAFWIALGLAVAGSGGLAPRDVRDRAMSGSADPPRGVFRSRWPIALLLGGLLVFSVPFRSRQELAGVDVTRLSYGLFEWGTDPDGTRRRWSGSRATLFVNGRARLVEIPLSGVALPSGVVQQVEVRLDGRLANRIVVGPDWQRLRVRLPADPSTEPRRLDLLVSPTWVPAELFGDQDRRVLGVKVGEIKTTHLDPAR